MSTGLLVRPHFRRLEALRHVRHLLQGEEPTITMLEHQPTDNSLADYLTIEKGWNYDTWTADGLRLPADVQFELQIAEQWLTSIDIGKIVAIRHGEKQFQIMQPSPFAPTGLHRFWRFWLTTSENLI